MKKIASMILTALIVVATMIVPLSATDVGISAPEKITATSKNATTIKISWSKVDEAVKYIIYCSTDGKSYKKYGSATKNSATIKNLEAETKYFFRVKSVDNAGNKSALSKTAATVTKAETAAMTIVSAPGRVKNGKTATLEIKGEPNTKYTLYVEYETKSGEAKGIGSQTTDSDGYAKWTWKVGTRTIPGVHPILINKNGNTVFKTSFETYKK